MKRFSLLMFLLPLLHPVSAQETWGISNSNFAGSMGIFLNPSSIAWAPYRHEYLVVAGDVFADNNYLYIKRNSGLVPKTISGEAIPQDKFGENYTPKPLKRAYASSYLMGPSYIRNYDKWAWGAHIAFRNAISATDVPYHLAKFIYQGFDYSPQHNIRYTSGPFRGTAMGWFELGGTIAKTVMKAEYEKHVVKVGATFAFAAGSYGIFTDVKSIDYIVPNAQLLVVNSLTGVYGRASPMDGDHIINDLLKVRGIGGRTTVGATYINSLDRAAYECYESADRIVKYKYRLGLSVMDLGMVKFSKVDNRLNNFENRSAYWPGIDTLRFLNWFYIDTIISNKFYGNPRSSKIGESFTLFMPAALSIQYDRSLRPRYYANLSVVQRLPIGKYRVNRSNQAALTLRYETRKFEWAIPVSFFEYKEIGVGLALRYGVLVLGTDRLGTYTGLFDSPGFDFFFGIKWDSCGREFKAKRKSKSGCDL